MTAHPSREGGAGTEPAKPGEGRRSARGLLAGAVACALLAYNAASSSPHRAYEWHDWVELTAAIRTYVDLDLPIGAGLPGEGDTGWVVVERCRRAVRAKVAALGIQPWQFWRTIHPRPFVGEGALLSAAPRPEDPGRAWLLAHGFRLLGGISPFLLAWLGVFAAFPLLLWSAWELFRAGRPMAGTVYPCLIASLPLTASWLSRSGGFEALALLSLVPLGVYGLTALVEPAGLLFRAGVAGALFGLCAACARDTRGLLPAFLLAFLPAAVRLRAPGGRKATLLLLALAAFVAPEAISARLAPSGDRRAEVLCLAVLGVLGLSIVADGVLTSLKERFQRGAVAGGSRGSGAVPPISRRKAAAFWVVMLAGPLLVTLIILELVLRSLVGGGVAVDRAALDRRLEESQRTELDDVRDGNLLGVVKPSAWRDVVYELKPGHEWLFIGKLLKTNSHGFRGHEYSRAKPAGTFRIVGIGDSIMFGWGVEGEETYLSLLEHELAPQGSGGVEALNFGVPGYNTVQEVGLFREKALGFDPDVVVINYVLNDWMAPLFLQDPNGEGTLASRSRLIELVSERLQRDATRDDYFAHPGLRGVWAALQELGRLTGERHIPVVFFIYPEPLSPDGQQGFRAHAKENGFLYVDMFGAFDRYCKEHGLSGPEAFNVSWQDRHPNVEGHRLIAATLKPVLTTLMREKSRPAMTQRP